MKDKKHGEALIYRKAIVPKGMGVRAGARLVIDSIDSEGRVSTSVSFVHSVENYGEASELVISLLSVSIELENGNERGIVLDEQ